MARKDYISDTLHKIRIQDKVPTGEHSFQYKDGDQPDRTVLMKRENEMGKEYKKALEKRRDEYLKTKRDIVSRFTESIAILSSEMEERKRYLEEFENTWTYFTEILDRIEKIDDSDWDEDYSSELAEAMKAVEDARLEFLRCNAKLEKAFRNGEKEGSGKKNDSILPEIVSLSFWQVFRLGLIFTLPGILALLVVAVLIALGVYVTIRL